MSPRLPQPSHEWGSISKCVRLNKCPKDGNPPEKEYPELPFVSSSLESHHKRTYHKQRKSIKCLQHLMQRQLPVFPLYWQIMNQCKAVKTLLVPFLSAMLLSTLKKKCRKSVMPSIQSYLFSWGLLNFQVLNYYSCS